MSELPEKAEFFIQSRNLAPKSEQFYRKVLKQFFKFVKKEDVSQEDVLRFVVHLKQRGLSPRSMAMYIMVVRSYLKFLDLPTQKIKLPTIPIVFKKALNEDELKSFFKVKLRDDYKIAFRLMAFSGMRIGEVLNLKVDDIDVENRTIKVFGKRLKERMVIIDEVTAELLKEYLKDKKGKVFKKLYERKVQYKIKTVAKRAGIKIWKEVTPHILRHTFSALWEKHGGTRGNLKYLLGHRPDTTDTYATDIRELRNMYDRVMNPIAKEIG